MIKYTPEKISHLNENEIFVFGSNLAGHHGGGAALAATRHFGAVWGEGVGMTGQCYAIPTMQGGVETIKPYVDQFIEFAKNCPDKIFLVTRIACGIAGFTDEEIAPLFAEALKYDNIALPHSFVKVLASPYMDRCFYYKGEKHNPFTDEKASLWNMEQSWLFLNLKKGRPYSETIRKNSESGNVAKDTPTCAPLLMGAIMGDVCGSIYEFAPNKSINVSLQNDRMSFTDDSVLTIAIADWLLKDEQKSKTGLVKTLKEWVKKYHHPMGGYGGRFLQWFASDNAEPYNSWGNGSAMRVSSIGFAFHTLGETLEFAKRSAEVTHNHPEGIKGAQATAAAIFLARTGSDKNDIRQFITEAFGYDLNRTCDEIRPQYHFDESCRGTVPEAIIAFLDSNNYEEALRLTISLGGDADTMGAITGAIAGAYYQQMDTQLYQFGWAKLPDDIRRVVTDFTQKYAE